MTEVREHFDVFPFSASPRVLRREESLLLAPAEPGKFGQLWPQPVEVDVVHFDLEYHDMPFAKPRYLYEGPYGRIEWQQMNFRQPFYHRNLDVDEMAYQIAGDRTLMTEFGTAELRPGDFVRLPAGVAHDNWGRKESHILWYLPEPFAEELEPVRHATASLPPFEGWEPAILNEAITDCMGTGPHDVAAQRSDERLILENASTHSNRLAVVRAAEDPRDGSEGRTVEWVWSGPTARIGVVSSGPTPGLDYIRHRNADEIQYQISGHRLLVTQHGTVEVGPGDFIRIPIGLAFTSISAKPSRYIATVSFHRLPRVYEASRGSERWTAERIQAYRESVMQPA
ncbi:MAG: hypothetical protein M3130_03500 [Actinomycetota bacterium]|nr:hypothetical protein [Actinomycetota bacterium]